ncbi:MAG: hypothetical protein LVQ95_01970 [Candidatus Micrarchaeales archaeon]|nr:hypothetical protein [Candidatus Micrarchaeales archaeon]
MFPIRSTTRIGYATLRYSSARSMSAIAAPYAICTFLLFGEVFGYFLIQLPIEKIAWQYALVIDRIQVNPEFLL